MSGRVQILGVPVDPVTMQEAVERIINLLSDQKQHHVMTPNSEMLVAATRNNQFKKILNETSLNIPDSAGLLFAAKLTRQKLPERVTGVDTVSSLCKKFDVSCPVFLLGGADGIAAKAAEKLMKNNPSLIISGVHSGSPSDDDADDIIAMINAASPRLLFVAYGAPKQDMWIHQHLPKMPTVKVAMGVGGTFDFLAGKALRAPKILQSFHLEWFWRLITEPRRIKRILTAVFIFPLLVIVKRRG